MAFDPTSPPRWRPGKARREDSMTDTYRKPPTPVLADGPAVVAYLREVATRLEDSCPELDDMETRFVRRCQVTMVRILAADLEDAPRLRA